MKDVWILGGALAVSLSAAWWTYTRDAEAPSSGHLAMYAEAEPARIAWRGDDREVVLEPRSDTRGGYVWVEVEQELPVLADDRVPATPEGRVQALEDMEEGPDQNEGPEPPQGTRTETWSFKGNARADELYEAFAPLHAMRELPFDGDLEAFGLDEPEGHLQVALPTQTIELRVGGRPFGSRHHYVLHDQRLYLVPETKAAPLRHARRQLVDRTLQPLTEQDMEQIRVQRMGRVTSFYQRERDDRARAHWTLGRDEAENPAIRGWVERLSRLRAREYLAQPPEQDLEPAVMLRLRSGTEEWRVELLRDDQDPPSYFARSDHNRSLVKVGQSQTAELITDLDHLLDDSGVADP